MNVRRGIGGAAAVVILVALGHEVGSGMAPTPTAAPLESATPSPVQRPAAVRDRAPQGVGSCSATACHGGVAPANPVLFPSTSGRPVLRNECTTWLTRDDHARAYEVLLSPRSRGIAERLAVGGAKVAAHEDARCLACHATPGASLARVPEVVRQDGVGCESCHGAAEEWLGRHTQAGWRGLGPAEKLERYGMRPIRALADRAAVCVDCHVGTTGRDVNHDLIAAGHPRLNFEFAAFLANMPPHWVEDNRGGFGAEAWAVGQAATARAGARLLVTRARQAAAHPDASPWPEFSEYDCFACHHDLADETWRQSRGSGPTTGIPTWGSWLYPMALTLAGSKTPFGSRDVDGPFASLQGKMARFGSDPSGVAGDAQALAAALDRWLRGLPAEPRDYDATKLKDLIAAVETRDRRRDAPGWDGAAQHYLALQPLRLSLKGLDPAWKDAGVDAELKKLFESLQFPPGYDSPRRYDPTLQPGGR
jgi:hypothetical protein